MEARHRVNGLLLAGASLLILMIGGVGLVVVWFRSDDAAPLPTFTATLQPPSERSLAATDADTTTCIVRSIETMPASDRTCISVH
ncbi:MAG: hypothetical protein F6K00_05155 [Leptolyngbya sp. SIOISBB]|nr:hypothetical protein [Leptolyngbya sp. SIOISBB]